MSDIWSIIKNGKEKLEKKDRKAVEVSVSKLHFLFLF